MMTSTVLAVALLAAAPVSETLRVDDATPMRIHASGAKVRLAVSSTNRLTIEGELDRALDRVAVMRDREGVVVRLVPLGGAPRLVYGEIVVRVPRGSPVALTTITGDVHVASVTAPLRVETAEGDVRVEGGGPEVRVQTLTGTIEVEASPVADLQLESVEGTIRFDGALADGARCEVHSVLGQVEVRSRASDGPIAKLDPR